MANLFIKEESLTAIGDAIRAKTGTTDLLSPSGMATAIEGIETGGGELPEEAFVISGDCQYRFANNGWNWFIDTYGDKITTQDIIMANYMFNSSGELESIPFEFNFNPSANGSGLTEASSMFAYCYELKEIKTIYNLKPKDMSSMFNQCQRLRYLPEFVNLDLSTAQANTSGAFENMFSGCYSLRSIPEEFFSQMTNPYSYYFYAPFYNFSNLYALDEIRGLNLYTPSTMSSNIFSNSFANCHRLKEVIFATQEDGTPYSCNFSKQTINLAGKIGYGLDGYAGNPCTNYNSGITADKKVTDDATYAALKDDPDWFTADINYSRYNHDSAVNTINSLPDVSAGTGNTIRFEGASGANTDGGAINTLTEEEIAVASAKGWTVTLT